MEWYTSGRMRIELLGVPVDGVTRAEAGVRLGALLAEGYGHLVTTPNPEMVVGASKDDLFLRALQRADLALPDGVGLLFGARIAGARLPERVSGADMVGDLCAMAARRGLKMFLLGGRGDVAKRAGEALCATYEGLRVVGAESGGEVTVDAEGVPHVDGRVIERIWDVAPDVILVAFGHGVQEKWLAAHLADLPTVRVGMGVGGTFDFLAGDVRRAPHWVRSIGLEWLWRLGLQPWRLGRIWTAVVVFPWLVLTRGR